jgi:hypothetical protein
MRTAILGCLLCAALGARAADKPALLKLTLPPIDRRLELDSTYFAGGTIERPIEPRTEVDHRFGPDGPVASAGYLCGLGGIGPDSEPIPGGPASVYSHAGTFLGASLAMPIR